MLAGTSTLLYVGLGHAMSLTKSAHRLELFLLMYFLDMSETGSQVHCCKSVRTDGAMDEGSERDKTWGRGGLPTLPGLYHSTIQPSRRGFF